MEKRKSIILKISGAATAIILLLTFLSSTIHSLGIAGVVVGNQQRGGLITNTVRIYGTLDFVESMSIYTCSSGRISYVVSPGDFVEEGDVLFTIQLDTADILERLEFESSRLDIRLASRSHLESELLTAGNRLSALAPAAIVEREAVAPNLLEFERRDMRLAEEIHLAYEFYHTQQLLYASGAIARVHVDDASRRLQNLVNERLQNEENRALAISEHGRSAIRLEEENRLMREQARRVFYAEQSSLNSRIADLQHSLSLLELEIREMHRQIDLLLEQFDEEGIIVAYAPCDGIVTDFSALHNSHVGMGRPVMRIAFVVDNIHQVTVPVPDSVLMADLSIVTRRVSVVNPAVDAIARRGEIIRIITVHGRSYAVIDFISPHRNQGGERLRVLIEDMIQAADFGIIPTPDKLPNTAIREDINGYFILYTEMVSNFLVGSSYYARRRTIEVIYIGERYTFFRFLLDEGPVEEPIIINSDRPVYTGDRVRPVAAG